MYRILTIVITGLLVAFMAFMVVLLALVVQNFKEDPGLAVASVAIGTLALAMATMALAFFTVRSIKNTNKLEERRSKEKLLKDVIKWAANVRAYISSLATGFNDSQRRMNAADRYFELKYEGKTLEILVKNQNLYEYLLEQLEKAIVYFDGPDWSGLANGVNDNKQKRKGLEDSCENVIKEGSRLLKK